MRQLTETKNINIDRIRWEYLTSARISALAGLENSVVVVPVGAIEQHGHHLPAGTDKLLVNGVCEEAVRLCLARKVSLVLTPCLWLGRSFHHVSLGGTLTARLETFIRCIEDISLSLADAGFRRQVFVNGHGGNMAALDSVVQEIGATTGVRPLALNYFDLGHETMRKTRRSGLGGMSHACEFETALMLHLHPELVGAERLGRVREPLISGLRADLCTGGQAVLYQQYSEMSPTGAVGSPELATAENGNCGLMPAPDGWPKLLWNFVACRLCRQRPAPKGILCILMLIEFARPSRAGGRSWGLSWSR